MTPRIPLGDSHNFGRRVSVGAGRVHKPRTLLWEWLVLGAKSPLRQLLDEAAERDGLRSDAFAFLPALSSFRPRAREGGEVERIALEAAPRLSSRRRGARSRESWRRSLALFSWLGVSDLHWENLVLGGRAGAA